MQNLQRRLDFFLEYGYLHGIRYLGQRCGFFGKIFWVLVMVVSAMGMAYIFRLTLDSFRQDVVIVNLDTAYLHWTNTFLAISLCVSRGTSTKRLHAFAETYFKAKELPQPPKIMSYVKILQDYIFVSPTSFVRSFDYCSTVNDSCGVNIEDFKRGLLPMHCNQILHNLTYLEREYVNCDDLFKTVNTEVGICFIANSLHSYGMDPTKLPLIYDRSDPVRSLSLKYSVTELAHINFYIHSPEQLPYFNMDFHALDDKGSRYVSSYNPIEVDNANDVRDISIDVRKCRFPDERLDGSFFEYSFTSCLSNLRILVELAECNCTIPSSPIEYASLYCNYDGLRCIANVNIAEKTKDLQYKEDTKCMPSCIEMEINTIRFQRMFLPEHDQMGELSIDITNVPTMRYKRNVAKTQLDLVVAVGGVIGLFFGASILTLFEFFHIWLVRRIGEGIL